MDYRFIKPVRQLRNQTLSDFSVLMRIDTATLSKLENQILDFSPYYQSRFKDAIKHLDISNTELEAVRRIIEIKQLRGY